ncbi:MAG: NAD(P)H-hydrate dehydratase [Acidobacteria bacterium]|nr:NAD(P)H-hydrate dehydratase [Acidobacteriota bacterium]MCI0717447.1 NAD(P)H-hydrate dehydratase [Acidobacteriota bacterium]
MKVLTAAQMREVDRLTTERYGIPSLLLMENAGSGVVRAMEAHFSRLVGLKVVVCCGKGNNGGDGFVAARHLMLRDIQTKVLLFAAPGDVKGDARVNLEILLKLGASIQIVEEHDFSEESIRQLFQELDADLLVDALLGTGARLPLGGFIVTILRHIARFPKVVAIDIPSGLDCDAMRPNPGDEMAPRAEITVTFTAPKPAHVFASRDGAIRRWVVVPIGSPAELVEDPRHWLNFFSEAEAAAALRRFERRGDSHKGDYGHVLTVAGSVGKTGAACLAARSALLAGAGLVTLATPSPCLPMVAGQMLETMTEPLEATDSGGVSVKAFDYGRVETLLEKKDVLAIGPGLGGHAETVEFVRRLVQETTVPVVLDADGINAFVGQCERLNGGERILVLTPHPGEFARLLGRPTSEVQADRVSLARQFAAHHQVHLVLKGHRTVYASPSGQVFVNSTGNPGMASGGSGDVLTGILAGLLGQALHLPFWENSFPGGVEQSPGVDTLHSAQPTPGPVGPFPSQEGNQFHRSSSSQASLENSSAVTSPSSLEGVIALGVYLHGLAGDLAAKTQGEKSLIASQIVSNLPAAFLTLEALNSLA